MSTIAACGSQGKGDLVLDSIKSYARTPDVHPLPHLIEVQLQSYQWFKEQGLAELFEEISPIVSYNGDLEMYFLDYWFGEPKYSEEECRARDMTLAAPLYVRVRLKNNEAGGEITEQDVTLAIFH